MQMSSSGPGVSPTPAPAEPTPPPTKPCPFCREPIRADAIKCRFCQSLVGGDASLDRRREDEPSSRTVLPGMPAHIPITPKPGRIVLGILLTVLGIWMLVSFLPEHRPISDEEVARAIANRSLEGVGSLSWRLKPNAYNLGYVLALVFVAGGLGEVVSGMVARDHQEVRCGRCATTVVAKKVSFGLECPRGHYAQLSGAKVLLAVVLSFLLLGLFGTCGHMAGS